MFTFPVHVCMSLSKDNLIDLYTTSRAKILCMAYVMSDDLWDLRTTQILTVQVILLKGIRQPCVLSCQLRELSLGTKLNYALWA